MNLTLKSVIATGAVLCNFPLGDCSEVYPGAMAAGSLSGLWLPPCSYALGYSFESPSQDGVEIYLTFDERVIPLLKSGITVLGSGEDLGGGEREEEGYLSCQGCRQAEDLFQSVSSHSLLTGIDDAIAAIDSASVQVADAQLEPLYSAEGFDFDQHFTFLEGRQENVKSGYAQGASDIYSRDIDIYTQWEEPGILESNRLSTDESYWAFEQNPARERPLKTTVSDARDFFPAEYSASPTSFDDAATTDWEELHGADEEEDIESFEGFLAYDEEGPPEELSKDEETLIAKAFQSMRNDLTLAQVDWDGELEDLSLGEETKLKRAFHSFRADAMLFAFDEGPELEELSSQEEVLLSKAFLSLRNDFATQVFDTEHELEELSKEEEAVIARAFDSLSLKSPLIAFDREIELEELAQEEERILAKAFSSFSSRDELLANVNDPARGYISYNGGNESKPSYLTAQFVKDITEELVFRDIPKVDASPEVFDVIEIQEDDEESTISSRHAISQGNDEMIAHLSGLEIDDDEFVAFNDIEVKAKAPAKDPPQLESNPDFNKKLELKLKIKDWEHSLSNNSTTENKDPPLAGAKNGPARSMVFVEVEPLKINQKKEPGRPKGSFSISSRPVTNAEYKEYLTATKKRPPAHWWRGSFRQGEEDLPVTGVSYLDAEAYAEWKGMRLPTQGELQLVTSLGLEGEFSEPSWVLIEEKGVSGMLKKRQRAYQANSVNCIRCVKTE